jgi:hypothetical protein
LLWYLGIAFWLLPAVYVFWRFGPADSVNPSVFERVFFGFACLLWPILGAVAAIGIAWSKMKRRKTDVSGSAQPKFLSRAASRIFAVAEALASLR